MRNPDAYVELDVVEGEFWWMNYLSGISFDGEEFRIPYIKTLTDTGATCTYLPNPVFKAVLNRIRSAAKLTLWKGDYYMDCADIWKLPVIEFLYGGYWLEFSPEDYMVEDDGVSGSCFLCILKETESPNEALLGNGFLRGFYSTHDLETNKFGFAPHATSNKADPRPG